MVEILLPIICVHHPTKDWHNGYIPAKNKKKVCPEQKKKVC